MSMINGCGDEEIYGYLFPGWYLCRLVNAACPYEDKHNRFVMHEGNWGITNSNDPSFVFALDPIPDDDDHPQLEEVCDHYRERLHADAETCYRFVQACIDAGYDIQEGGLAIWVSNRMYELLQVTEWKPVEVYRLYE